MRREERDVPDFRGIFGCRLIRCGGEGERRQGFASMKWKGRERRDCERRRAAWYFGFGEAKLVGPFIFCFSLFLMLFG
jgi:hypothetical protein